MCNRCQGKPLKQNCADCVRRRAFERACIAAHAKLARMVVTGRRVQGKGLGSSPAMVPAGNGHLRARVWTGSAGSALARGVRRAFFRSFMRCRDCDRVTSSNGRVVRLLCMTCCDRILRRREFRKTLVIWGIFLAGCLYLALNRRR
jgi:hypothetical protein